MTAQMLAHYRVLERLGEGGMGAVYRALDEMLDRDVAIKVLKPELAHRPTTLERFRAEAVTLAKLDHPGIARVYGFSRHEDQWFIVMEFVPGETLLARLQRAGRLSWAAIEPIAIQLLDALEYAHGRNVIHRDIKPANLILCADGRLKVTDFGIARVLGTTRATRTGHIVGTLEYMSPEQIRSEELDGRADLYAVGVVLYELVTGQVPFSGTTDYEIMTQHLEAPVPSLRPSAVDAPEWFDAILQRALAKRATDRFATAAEFRRALQMRGVAEPAMTIKPTRLATPGDVQRPVPRPTRLAAGSAGVAFAAAPVRRLTKFAADRAVSLRSLTWRQTVAAASLLAMMVVVPVAIGRVRSQNSGVGTSVAEQPGALTPVTNTATAPGQPTPVATRPSPDPISEGGPRRTPPPPPVITPPVAPSDPTPRPGDSAPPPAPRDTSPPQEPAPPSASPGEPVPATTRRTLRPVQFEKIKVITTEGEKSREVDAVLRLEADRVVIKDADTAKVLRTFAYARIEEVTYSRSKSPVWKTDEGARVVRGFAKLFSFIKATRHWLTVEGSGQALVLRLDGDNFADILSALEDRAEVSIERVAEK